MGDGAGSAAKVLEECAYGERITPAREPGGLPVRGEMDEGMQMDPTARVEEAVEGVGGVHASLIEGMGIIALDRPRADAVGPAVRTAIVPAPRGPIIAVWRAAVVPGCCLVRRSAGGSRRGIVGRDPGRGVRDLHRPAEERTEGDDDDRE